MIKTLSKSIREFKKPSILTPITVGIEVLIECFIPLIMAYLVDKIYDNNLTAIIISGVILLCMAMASLFFGAISGKFCATASCGFAKNLRNDLFLKVQQFSFTNIDNFSSASLVTRLTTDVSNVQNAYMMIIRIAIRCPLMLIFSLIMCLTINASLSLVFLAIIPILTIGMFFIVRAVGTIFNKVFKKYDALNNSVQENVKAMRVVKAYVREDFEKEKFEKSAEDVRRDFTKAEKILALVNPLMMACVYIAVLAIAVFGSIIIVNTFGGVSIVNGEEVFNWGELSTGQLTSLITYTMQILISLLMLSMVLVMISMSKASAERITAVLQTESTISDNDNPIFEIKDGSVDFEKVDFKYSDKAERFALEDVDLHINSGETVGILGGTGSSKTTLIQLISRLYDATDGVVKVGGIDVKDYDLKALRDAVAVVLQKNILFSGTIKENLRWGNENASDDEIIEVCKQAQAHDFIMTFPEGYDTYIEQGGSNVSGGQKQRLCIARALLKKPKILILDDSTSAVDTKTDALIRKALKTHSPEVTKIIIAQRVASIKDSDKIIIMDKGTIVACGKHDELLKTSEIYREVYETQNKAGDENE